MGKYQIVEIVKQRFSLKVATHPPSWVLKAAQNMSENGMAYGQEHVLRSD